MKRKNIVLIPFVVVLIASCTKRDFEVKGVVVNKNTGLVMEGVKVKLKDGLEGQESFFGGTEPENFDSTYTGSDGKFKVSVRTKSTHGFIIGSKSGYKHYTADGTIQMVEKGDDINDAFVIEMEGYAYFNSPFQKTSTTPKNTDSLVITLLSYENLNDDLRNLGSSKFKGLGPFYFFYDEDSKVNAEGDRYLRYKLEWTTDGVWYSKIDSIYLPTSLETYKEPIYY